MPPAGDENRSIPGISPASEVDVAALFEQLKAEVRGSAAALDAGVPADRRVRLAARAQAERLWPVSTDRSLVFRPGARGAVARPVKQALRKLMRWYVEPLAVDQKGYNEALLKLVDDLGEALDRSVAAGEGATRLVAELEERLTRLERRERAVGAPATVAAQPAAAAIPDYFAFESRMRGSISAIRARQQPYVDDFRAAAPVLDVGCGRGEFLELLRDAGIEATGVDADADMAAYAQGEGLTVVQADALAHLAALPDGSLGGIFASQLVEHLPPAVLFRLLELAVAKLRPGGLFVAETINPLSPLALRNYFADLTHAQPVVPETLELLARQAGFAEVETRYLNEPERRLEVPAEGAAGDTVAAENARRLNEVVFAPLDYAVLARTPAGTVR
jgi:SAM-dependent methyltransferase